MPYVLVVYPSGPSFDHEYYINSHMKLVTESWTDYGLQSWEILKFPSDAPYQVQATLKWDSLEAFEKAAAGEEAKLVFGDIKNFTASQPILLKGEVTASSN